MSKPVILTGLRANNELHIGNYFGALLPMVDMSKKHVGDYQINLFVPDLHSFTTPIDHDKLYDQIISTVKFFVASGLPLNNPAVHIYRQSFIPAHSELTWILFCFTGMGEMSRMTQYKDKSTGLSADRISVGLFNYPVLMASDILLYNAAYVPVGEDQTQHLEFTRNIAERMNQKFGQELFVIPKPVEEQHKFFGKDQGLRIRDLANPNKKMSKSSESDKGVIFLNDDPKSAQKKIMSATTDSEGEIGYDPEKRPGISNLLDIYALVSGNSVEEVANRFEGQQSYGDFKTQLAEAVAEFLADFQKRLSQVDEAAVLSKLEESEREVAKVANQTLLRVQKAVGLRPRD